MSSHCPLLQGNVSIVSLEVQSPDRCTRCLVKGKWDKPIRLVQIAPVWRQVGCDVDGAGIFYDFLPEVICHWTVLWAFVGEALFDDDG
jgi:hypothetical protein